MARKKKKQRPAPPRPAAQAPMPPVVETPVDVATDQQATALESPGQTSVPPAAGTAPTPEPEAAREDVSAPTEREPDEQDASDDQPLTVTPLEPAAADPAPGAADQEPAAAESLPGDELTPAAPVGEQAGTSAAAAPAEGAPPRPVARPVEGVAAWRRLVRMGLPRATKANVLAGLLAILLGLAIATQVQLTQERGLSELSQTDLIRVLDDVSSRSSRLDAQIRELEATRDRLRSGTGSSAEALAQAQKRADTLGILAGTVGATGPGVTITLSDPQAVLTGPIVLDLIQELRDAGAEAIDVGGVRVVASSFVGEVDGKITIDGTPVTRPIRIAAIGDPKTLSSAMTIPGGIVETVRQKGASASVVEQDTVEITSLHDAREPKIATVPQ